MIKMAFEIFFVNRMLAFNPYDIKSYFQLVIFLITGA